MRAVMSDTTPLFERYYHNQPGFLDGTAEFHALCEKWLGRGKILEIGAGPSNQTSDFLATLGPTWGIDVSGEVADNRALQEGLVYDGVTLPFEDASFDGCVSNYVLEHVEVAERHLHEVSRVLRPGGHYVFRTPNLGHYVAIGSRLLPHIVHTGIANKLRRLPDDAHEPWPTFYRLNRRSTISAASSAAGLRVVELRMIEKEPYYARSSALLFYPLMAYERLVNSGKWGEPFRANIFGVLEKPM